MASAALGLAASPLGLPAAFLQRRYAARGPPPPAAASLSAATTSGAFLPADSLQSRAAARQQRFEQLMAESAMLEAAMGAKAQEWGMAWQRLQSEAEALHQAPALPQEPAAPTWVGPLVSSWCFTAGGLQQGAPGARPQTFADWLAARLLSVGAVVRLWSAALATLGHWSSEPAQQDRR